MLKRCQIELVFTYAIPKGENAILICNHKAWPMLCCFVLRGAVAVLVTLSFL